MLMGWIKRVVPFVLAFTFGLFIASFFVSLALPKMKFERRYGRHHERSCQFKLERDSLQYELDAKERENRRLRQMMSEDSRYEHTFKYHSEAELPPPPPPAPVAPRVIR